MTTELFSLSPADSSGTVPSGEIQLSPEQQTIHDSQLAYLTGKADIAVPFSILKGYAGTGKTTVTNILLRSLIARGLRVGIAAPTHKAVKILKRTGMKGVQYRTVAGWLALKEHKNEQTGEVTFIVDKAKIGEEPIRDIDIMLLDETSMLTKENFDRIVPWIKNHNKLRVAFIGDPLQIPPVKEKDSMPFLYGEKWGALVTTLTTIHRQKQGNPILAYVTYIRENYTSANLEEPVTHLLEDGTGVRVLEQYDEEEEQQILEKHFSDPRFKEDPDFMKVVAWTNDAVDDYNVRVREILYRNRPDFCALMPGEYLIVDKPITLSSKSIITINEELKVLSTQIDKMNFNYTNNEYYPDIAQFKIYKTTVEYFTDNGRKTAVIPIIHEESRADFNQFIAKLVKIAQDSNGRLWRQYFTAREKIAWVKYNYAITCHKAQGSTYENCMVLKGNILNSLNVIERNRILYTAGTRASKTLYIKL